MSFANGWVLLLVPVLLLLLRSWLRRQRSAILWPDTTDLLNLPAVDRQSDFFHALLRFLILICFVVALAGPRIPDLKTRIPTQGIAMIFVLDVSASMQTESFLWDSGEKRISRSEAAKRAFRLFVEGGELPDGTRLAGRSGEQGTDLIGLVSFAEWPQPISPPTLSHRILLEMLARDRVRSLTENGTNIGDALTEGLLRLEKVDLPEKVLILLSDGEHNVDRDEPDRKPLKPRQAAQLAANLGVRIYAIDTGGDPSPDATADEKQQRKDGRETNERIAALTGGRSFDAKDGPGLLSAIEEIDQRERRPIPTARYRRFYSLTGYCIAAGIGLLILLIVREKGLHSRLP